MVKNAAKMELALQNALQLLLPLIALLLEKLVLVVRANNVTPLAIIIRYALVINAFNALIRQRVIVLAILNNAKTMFAYSA